MAIRRSRHLGGYDIYLEYGGRKVGLLLGRDDEGNVRWWPGVAPLLTPQVRQSSFSYEHIPPEIDVPTPFENWHQGAGFEDAFGPDEHSSPQQHSSHSYSYSRGVDASYGNRLYLSPERQALVEDDATAIGAAPVKFYASSLGDFLLAGAFIYRLDADGWDEVDSGGGTSYTDIIEMDGVLYAARGSGADYKYSSDGSTWTAFTDSDDNFSYWAVRGVSSGQAVLWGIKSDGTIKNTTNGANSGVAWSAADAVGHTSETVRSLIEANDDIYAFKEEGFYRYTGAATEDVWTGGAQMRASTNGSQPLLWVNGKVYVPYGNSLYEYEPLGDTLTSPSLRKIFPTREMVGHPEINGTVTALTGDASHVYVAVKNSAGNTYIIKGNPEREEWHTWVYLGANDCNAMLRLDAGSNAHANNPVLLVGYGTAAHYFILPRPQLRPEDDSNYRFDTAQGKIYGPWVDIGARAFNKFLNGGRVVGTDLDATNTIVLSYEIDHSGSEVTLVTANSNGTTSASVSGDVSFGLIRYVITMDTDADTTTPICLGVVLNSTPNPPRKRTWTFEVVVGDQLPLTGGGVSRYSGKDLESFLFDALTERATLYDRRGDSYVVRILDVEGVSASPTDNTDDSSTRVKAASIS